MMRHMSNEVLITNNEKTCIKTASEYLTLSSFMVMYQCLTPPPCLPADNYSDGADPQ